MRWMALTVIVCVLGWSGVSTTRAEAPGATTNAAPEIAATKSAPHFGPEYTTIAYVPDPLPHLQTLLQHPKIQTLLLEVLNQDPKAALAGLDTVQVYVPQEITIGFTDAGSDFFGSFVRGWLLIGLCNGAREAEEGEALDQLQALLVQSLQGTRIEGLRLFVGFRNPGTSNLLFATMSPEIMQIAQDNGFDVKADVRSLRIRGPVLSDLQDPAVRAMFLEIIGIVRSGEDRQANALGEALSKLTLDVEIRNTGEGLMLTIGAPPEAKDVQPSAVFNVDAATVAQAKWSARRVKESLAESLALWKKWESHPVGEATSSLDAEGLLETMKWVARYADRAAAHGDARIWHDDDLHGTTREYETGEIENQSASKLLAWVPDGSGGYYVDSLNTAGDFLGSILAHIEDQIAKQELKADIADDEAKLEMLAEISRVYYQRLGDVRKRVFDEADQWFANGHGLIMTVDGKVREFETSFVFNDLPFRFAGRDLPLMEFALLGIPEDGKQPAEFIKEVYDGAVKGVLEEVGTLPREAKSWVRDADLGLGVPTQELDLSWIEAVVPADAEFKWSMDGDGKLHCFMHDGVFVLSTSPRLSKTILQVQSNASMQLKLQEPRTTLVENGRWTGELMAQQFESLFAWIEVVDRTFEEQGVGQNTLSGLLEAGKRISAMCRTIEELRWTGHQEADTRNTQWDVILAK